MKQPASARPIEPRWPVALTILAVLVGAKVAGVLGVVLAVPIASTVKDVMEPYKPNRASPTPAPASVDGPGS